MKPEVAERLFIEALFEKSKTKLVDPNVEISYVERLTGDASTRRYYRLIAGDKSYVACLDNPSEIENVPFIQMQNFLSDKGVRVPRIYDNRPKKGYILEEDLGDMTLLQRLSSIENKEQEFDIFKKNIDVLLQMHKIPSAEIEKANIFNLKFDKEKLKSEIEFSVNYFFKKFLNVDDEKVISNIKKLFEPICERASSTQMVFTHRDYHSRNIMVKEDDYIVIDFQDARWGVPQYDLVSILEDCYYEIDRENKYKLKKYYFESLGAEILGYDSFDKFEEIYRDMALQRVFKAIGSFAYIYDIREDIRYVKFIGFAMEKIKQILFREDKYKDLRLNLFKYYYES